MRAAPRTVLPTGGHRIAAALTVLVAVLLTLVPAAAAHVAPDGPVPHSAVSATGTPRPVPAVSATGTRHPAATGTRHPAATGTRHPAATGTRHPAATGTRHPAATGTRHPAATGTPRPRPAAHTPGPEDTGHRAEDPCATGCAAPAARARYARYDHGAERPDAPDHHATPAHGTTVPFVGVRASARPALPPVVPGRTPHDRGRAPPAPTGT